MKRTVLTLLFGSVLFGCASTSDEVNNVELPTINAEVCCSSYSDFSWTQLSTTEEIEFQIDNSTPVWEFPEGASHFASFIFAEQSRTVEVTLSSKMVEKSVLAPKVVTLDSTFNVIDEYDLDDFKILYSDAFSQNRYEATISFDASKTPYLVVYTPQDQIGNEITIPHPAKVRAVNSGDPLPIVTDLKYTHGYLGELEIKLKTISLNTTVKRVEPKTISIVKPQAESVLFYQNAIKKAVNLGDIPKALALLEEAKALNIDGAQEAFVNAVNGIKK